MTITQSSTRLVALTAGIAVAAALMVGAFAAAPAQAASLTQAQISSIISLLQSFGADQATINNVQASLNGQATPGTGTGSGGACPALTRDLQVGSTGADVMALQKFLNTMTGTIVSLSGAGSPGNETSTFGPATKAAVIKFQTLYNITPIAGYAGAKTRAQIAKTCGGTSTVPGPTPTTGTGLSVSAGAQPANALAPAGALRIAFTNFTVTAGSDGDVTLSSVVVERQGVAADASFSGVVLIDNSTGVQVGTTRTLNSNHQATIGDTIVIPRGTSKTFVVAANRTSAGTHGGEIASFAVVAINTSATVSGSLPIIGASHTINETLALGSVSTSTSAFDPGAAQTKNIGDTGIKFTGIRFQAGSAEDLKLYSIRWRQVGSISSSDLANIKTNVNGTVYPTTVDSSGKYYTTIFPGGLSVTKGNSIDVYIVGDLVGSNAAGRTADFDIDKATDVYFVGQLYGYGVNFSPAYSNTPWQNGYVFTINAGAATTISKATEVAAQNIAINVTNQPLGGFVTDFRGEAVTVSNMVVKFNYSSGAAASFLLTNVSLVNENGAVVAGPVDATQVTTVDGGTQQTATFTDSVTFPTGRHVWTIKGKIPSGVSNNVTIAASTTPSGWTSPTGQTSGNSITISQGNFAMNTMTIRGAALSVTLGTTPANQSIVSGGQSVLFANVQLDASQSGEDVRVSSVPLTLTVGGTTGAVASLSSCQLFNGTTALNTGSNVPSSLASSGSSNTFTLDNSLMVPKGTIMTLALKCNVSSTATGTYVWSILAAGWTATGFSGQGVTVAATAASAGTLTVGSGTLVVSLDPSSPSYALAAAGSTGKTLGVYKFTASNESVNLTRIGLSLGTITASSTAADLTQVYLYNGATLVGTATFTGANRTATSTLSTPVMVPKDGSVSITIKADLAAQGASAASHPGALLTVDVDVNGATGNKNTQGVGADSSATVGATGSTAVAGVRVFKTTPTVAKLSPASLTLIAQAGIELYRFSITPSASGDMALNKLVVNIATSSSSTANGTTVVSNLKVFAYTDAALSNQVAGFTNGQVVTTVAQVLDGNNTATMSSVLSIPAGTTYYFKVTGDVAQVAGTTGSAGTVTTKITGDSAYYSSPNLLDSYVTGIGNFVWSPMSTSTTASTANFDWTNGFNVTGLPASGTDSVTLSK